MLTGAIVGGFTTSNILSAISLSSVTDNVEETDASTILTEGGRHCKNSCRIMPHYRAQDQNCQGVAAFTTTVVMACGFLTPLP